MRVGLACCEKRAQSEDRDEPVHGARSLDCKGHRAPVAHRIERSAPDRKAAGSIPARRTTARIHIAVIWKPEPAVGSPSGHIFCAEVTA